MMWLTIKGPGFVVLISFLLLAVTTFLLPIITGQPFFINDRVWGERTPDFAKQKVAEFQSRFS